MGGKRKSNFDDADDDFVQQKRSTSGSFPRPVTTIQPPPEAFAAAAPMTRNNSSSPFYGRKLLSGAVKPPSSGSYGTSRNGLFDTDDEEEEESKKIREISHKLAAMHGQGTSGTDLTAVVSRLLQLEERRMKQNINDPYYPLKAPIKSVVSQETLNAIQHKETSTTKPTLAVTPNPIITAPATTTTLAPSNRSALISTTRPNVSLGGPALSPTNPFALGGAAPAGSAATTSTLSSGFTFGAAAPSSGFVSAYTAMPTAAAPTTTIANLKSINDDNGDDNDDAEANNEETADDEADGVQNVVEDGWTVVKSFSPVVVKRKTADQSFVKMSRGELTLQKEVSSGKTRLLMKDLHDIHLNVVIQTKPVFKESGATKVADGIFFTGFNAVADETKQGMQSFLFMLNKKVSKELFELMKNASEGLLS